MHTPSVTQTVLTILVMTSCTGISQPRSVESGKEGSSATYKIIHPLHEFEATSKEVVYRAEIDPATRQLKTVSARVDVMTFDSGNSNRDSHAMEVVDAITYPDVTFASTSIVQTGDSVYVAGKLTFHGVTREVLVGGTTGWSANSLEIQGNFAVGMTAFSIDRPSLLMIPVRDSIWFSMHGSFDWK